MLIADVLCILLTCLKCRLALFNFLIISLYDFYCMSIGDLRLLFISIYFFDGRFVSLFVLILISILLLFLPRYIIPETMESYICLFFIFFFTRNIMFVIFLSMEFNFSLRLSLIFVSFHYHVVALLFLWSHVCLFLFLDIMYIILLSVNNWMLVLWYWMVECLLWGFKVLPLLVYQERVLCDLLWWYLHIPWFHFLCMLLIFIWSINRSQSYPFPAYVFQCGWYHHVDGRVNRIIYISYICLQCLLWH